MYLSSLSGLILFNFCCCECPQAVPAACSSPHSLPFLPLTPPQYIVLLCDRIDAPKSSPRHTATSVKSAGASDQVGRHCGCLVCFDCPSRAPALTGVAPPAAATAPRANHVIYMNCRKHAESDDRHLGHRVPLTWPHALSILCLLSQLGINQQYRLSPVCNMVFWHALMIGSWLLSNAIAASPQ
jgi:hypothetical protein